MSTTVSGYLMMQVSLWVTAKGLGHARPTDRQHSWKGDMGESWKRAGKEGKMRKKPFFGVMGNIWDKYWGFRNRVMGIYGKLGAQVGVGFGRNSGGSWIWQELSREGGKNEKKIILGVMGNIWDKYWGFHNVVMGIYGKLGAQAGVGFDLELSRERRKNEEKKPIPGVAGNIWDKYQGFRNVVMGIYGKLGAQAGVGFGQELSRARGENEKKKIIL
ncbi:hypothetical protein DV515_00016609, partial [Chloebia gouldiae]